ncbi:MAG: peptidase domain-containing ABC transporter [Sphingobacterium sp.]|uniref:peptidase domain-containing ABC transporter n=1 Tax=Sphingobacterium sp. TaxID=341027 RepID=UPI0028442276|nr:peptidase domain-containing ABC transporter [Sphingobacterium sp.]MDR3008603.1 peptidase domain-containing ABC transporter [Sphingobacterium sp.]
MKYSFYRQLDHMDCGATCLRIIAKQYSKEFTINYLRKICETGKQGVSLKSISIAAESIGLNSLGVKCNIDALREAPLPCILHWKNGHFVVLHKVYKVNGKLEKALFLIADPSIDGLIKVDYATFKEMWHGDESTEGIALFLEPGPAFVDNEESSLSTKDSKEITWTKLFTYLSQHKKYFFQIIIGLLAASLFQLLIPFLTQGIVDKGINANDINFIYIALIAQFVLMIGRTVIEFSRQGLLLFISTKINLSLLTDFWSKLMRLPISYFDIKQTGDIIQRIGDQHRIERFMTGNSINIMFSLMNLIVYSFAMLLYSIPVFFIFLIGSVLYTLWIMIFLKQRRKLNYKQFSLAAKENSATLEMVQGMQEIKLSNAEQAFRWKWENMQRGLFAIGFKNLSIGQMQSAGALFLNEGKNLLVTGIVATSVINGDLTLGAMLAIQYILGALNNPVQQLTGFIQEFQDAKISLERLNEIHKEKDEKQVNLQDNNTNKNNVELSIENLSFGFCSSEEDRIIKNLSLHIPAGKVTAIVGVSGSGKTTLLKILQKFYDEKYKGNIQVSFNNSETQKELRNIVPGNWRSMFGSVMQDGFIFNDSIAGNIAVGENDPDDERLNYAAKMANILDFIENLPLGFNTKIGMEGSGISMGQKQRILIARAIYTDPQLLFFDEATNSLDANNEKVILNNLQSFFHGRTVVVVAHRLSTVRNADQIVVLKNGQLVEKGTHSSLSGRKGDYFELVKNQLELGN